MRDRNHPTYEGRPLPRPDEDIVDQGLGFDLDTVMGRRGVLRILGLGAGALALAGCRTGARTISSASNAGTSPTASSCTSEVPEETAGPFPGDGSNGPDMLSESGIVRRDITSSIGDATGIADGIPLTMRFALTDVDNGCVPYVGAAVYVWHCDREGRYSLYSDGAEDQNYLRGVQQADADGVVAFDTIFPACYPGRWPHVHFEVYPSLTAAGDVANVVATSQLALPTDVCDQVYATPGYEDSISTFSQVGLGSDIVFSDDGGARQLGTVTGAIDAGLTVALDVPVGGAR